MPCHTAIPQGGGDSCPGSWKEGKHRSQFKLNPETPQAAERSRTEKLNREERVALAWSWRRVYCHEVTPGALNMKRRALVMRKPACEDRMGIALVTSRKGTELQAPSFAIHTAGSL